jgi:SAM-dependent methyltransferase
LFFPGIDAAMDGISRFAALSAGCEIGLFDRLEKGTGDPGMLAVSTGADKKALCHLLEVLADAGLVTCQDGFYQNLPVSSTYLVSWSPYTQIRYIRKTAVFQQEIWVHLTDRLREGPVSFEKGLFFREISLPAMAENALCGRLQRTILEVMNLPGFPACRRMVDLGGGHGLYAIALAAESPLLEAVVFDVPEVIALARENISRFRAGRVRTMAGDFFTDSFGSGYDIVLSSSAPSGKSVDLVERIADSLNPGGYFVNVQSGHQEKRRPWQELEWQLWTIDNEEKGRGSYTREKEFLTREYRMALAEAGLALVRETRIPDDYHADTTVRMMIAMKES